MDTKILEYNSYLYDMFFHDFSITREMLEEESFTFKSRITRDIILELINVVPDEWKPNMQDINQLVDYIMYRVDNLDVIISTIMTYNNR